MQLIAFLVVALCLLSTNAKPLSSNWTPREDASSHNTVKFTVALKQQNIKLLEQHALDVSDPDSPNYAEYWSKKDITNLVAPPERVSEEVVNYFRIQCPHASIKNFRDAVEVEATVECVKSLFQVEMKVYQHNTNEKWTVIKTAPGSVARIPSAIKHHVDFITGLSEFPVNRKTKTQRVSSDAIQKAKEEFSYNFIIPQTVRRLYNIPYGTKITNPKTSQSVIEFEPLGAPYISDMSSFAEEAGETFTNISHIVGYWDPDAEGESTLDIEYQTTLAPGADQYYITVNGWIYEMGVLLYNMQNTPLVNSVSYGWPEALSCESDVTGANCTGYTSQQYNKRSDNELAKLALAGISVIVCSQDEGAPSEANIDCSLDSTQPLWPIYPGCSPWATSVSATTLVDIDNSRAASALPPICNLGYTCDTTGETEYPCMVNNTYYDWTTGGGFSNYSTRPSWQKAAVEAYLKSDAYIPPTVFFQSGNRGYPDISALGSRILIWESGAVSVTAGTSASTPIISAIISLLNDVRLNAGKKPLGFVAPLLYKMAVANPKIFQDIIFGNNTCTEGACCEYGYGATEGWDPVTGLGTPDFMYMLSYVKKMKK